MRGRREESAQAVVQRTRLIATACVSGLLVVPVARHLEPESETAEASEAGVAARDRSVDGFRRARMDAAVLLADPGVDGEEVVTAQDPQQTFRGVGSEAALGEDRLPHLARGRIGFLPQREIQSSRRDTAREPRERSGAVPATDLRL